MPTSLQYPLERSRGLQQKWARLVQQGPSTKGSDGFTIVANTIPPREPDEDDDDDDEEQDEAGEDEPAIIREPDKDE
jgi:hypothetical protein